MIETYEVKPGILAVFFYDESGKAIYITLLPLIAFDKYQNRKMEMPENLVTKALEELLPTAKKAKFMMILNTPQKQICIKKLII